LPRIALDAQRIARLESHRRAGALGLAQLCTARVRAQAVAECIQRTNSAAGSRASRSRLTDKVWIGKERLRRRVGSGRVGRSVGRSGGWVGLGRVCQINCVSELITITCHFL
ncbi:MAG: hypothetical protein U1B30_16740, partial [Pseudomonadota bacterium]|nr:hypothetical protein [Pseudomonadota bacterium]